MKTKTLTILLSMLFYISILQAQNNSKQATTTKSQPTSFYALNFFGISAPMGDYASTDINNDNPGFATPGLDFSLSEGSSINHSNFGYAIKIDYTLNGFDLTNSFVNSLQIGPGWSGTVKKNGNYQYVTTLGGLYVTIPVKKFAFDFRLMGGYMYAQIPNLSIKESEDTAGVTISDNSTINSTFGNAFCFDVGTNVRWNLAKHFCLLLSYDFLYAKPKFSTTEENIMTVNGNQIADDKSVSNDPQPVSLSNISLGVGYVFGNK